MTEPQRYIGVRRAIPRVGEKGPWVAIYSPHPSGKDYFIIGDFETPEAAAHAFDAKVRELGLDKQGCRVNFDEAGKRIGFARPPKPLTNRSAILALYAQALENASLLMEDGDLEPTSALKQAAVLEGIATGDEMGKFMAWARKQWGIKP